METQRNCIGSHIPFNSKSLFKTCEFAITKGMSCFQFFLGTPMRKQRTRIGEKDIKKTKEYLSSLTLQVFSHLPYVYNLTGEKGKLIQCNDECRLYIKKELEYELGVLAQIGGCSILHSGSYKNRKKGIEMISAFLNNMTFPKDSKLALENCAGEGNKIWRDLDEFIEIYSNLTEKTREYIYICLDTAHLWGCGLYELNKVEEVKRLFMELKKKKILNRVVAFHLNDSEVGFGSKKDRHALLRCGEIWKNDDTGLKYLLKLARRYKIPCILETHVDDFENLKEICKDIN